jgi:hypothetical protein
MTSPTPIGSKIAEAQAAVAQAQIALDSLSTLVGNATRLATQILAFNTTLSLCISQNLSALVNISQICRH